MTRYLATAFLLLVLSLAGCASRPAHDQTLNEQGLNAMQAGNMEEAERLLTQAVQENPNNLEAYINLATLYQNTNHPEQARALYQRVIDGEATAEENDIDPEEAARLAQVARNSIAQMDREEAERQEEAKRQEALRQEAEAAELAAKAAVIAPPMEAEPVPAPAPAAGGYRIQTGAFAVAANAETMRARLVGRHAGLIKGKQVHLVKVNGLTKVQIGPFDSRDDANNACRALQRAGVRCFLRLDK